MSESYFQRKLQQDSILSELAAAAETQTEARAERPEREQQMKQAQSKPLIPAVRKAADFGEYHASYIWYPYIPRREYSLIIAESGTGKTYTVCKIAADLSNGLRLFGDERPAGRPQKTLIISSEDDGETLKARLEKCGADLSNVFICDRSASIGLNFTAPNFSDLLAEIKPDLVILDPFQAFIGNDIDVNRMNQMRAALQTLANNARVHNCGIILISHVNKREQSGNANNAAAGSTELVNAARSALILCFDDSDAERKDLRLLIHTKANHSALGRSIRLSVNGDGVQFVGFSAADKSTLELKARGKITLSEALERQKRDKADFSALCNAIQTAFFESGEPETRCSYNRIEELGQMGAAVWNGYRQKEAIGRCKMRLLNDFGLSVTPISTAFRENGKPVKGITISEA